MPAVSAGGKKGGKNIPFLDENIHDLEGGMGGRGGTEPLGLLTLTSTT
jgi:hypothetical protein